MSVSVGDLRAALVLDTAGFTRGVAEAGRATESLKGPIDRATKSVGDLGLSSGVAGGKTRDLAGAVAQLPGPPAPPPERGKLPNPRLRMISEAVEPVWRPGPGRGRVGGGPEAESARAGRMVWTLTAYH